MVLMSGHARGAWSLAWFTALLAGFCGRAQAYSYASPLADGCHELLTLEALRTVRAELAVAGPLPAEQADRAWIDDLPLDLPGELRDLAGASLVVGVRDNDLKSHHGLDNAELAQIHGNPTTHPEHCLRGPDDDEPGGSERAVQTCRDYIRGQVESALAQGRDAHGRPDGTTRMKVRVHLAFAGKQDIPAVLFWIQVGRALHALQDSFSHTLRSPDGMRVRTVLNWIDLANDRLVESRDGPAHRRALDECKGIGGLRAQRRERAIEASAALLRAALQPVAEPAVREVLDRYLSFEPGCDVSNHFCAAPELAFPADAFACSAHPARSGEPVVAWSCSALLLIALHRRCIRRRTRSGSASVRAACTMAVLALGAAHPQRVEAQVGCPALPPDTGLSRIALDVTFGGSIDETSLAAAAGARYRFNDAWLLGLDVEWNPWISIEAERARPGALNAYASVILRWLTLPDLALRTTGHVGASVLMFDLYGAPAGSVGPYLGLSLLGLELPLSERARLIIEPADVRVPIPHLEAIPLSYRQYRATLGLEVWL